MADLLLLTSEPGGATAVLPALALVPHRIKMADLAPSAVLEAAATDVVVLDGRGDLATARTTCRLIRSTGLSVPILLVLTEGGLTVVSADWGIDDIVLDTAGPAELASRLRLLGDSARASAPERDEDGEIEAGDLTIDPGGYTVRLRGRTLELTYKEFELLKYLMQHPGRVFTRAQLLQEVWGYDYYGGTRTVDVHVRRLRAKLGIDYETLIGTVRNVGYRFDPPTPAPALS
ncbi:DNA-binding response OmpR family regulator [Salana multivorans]|uniref:DNA-binding response OmpR family regulator n=1 Tax=Salana multivorans TaxID=120377 RepID=A0A3N2DBU3_9MICO|nr:response regulator transcription factor [Salana multivorans]OJX97688.1 MAG: transcriptional regulator [Micrococcales bacterium 73-15]ROR97260.1 DNA-binding response OmpR family regulator [Salana multivorans]